MKRLIIYTAILFSLAACEKSIDFNAKDLGSFMVVNSYISPQDTLRARLTKSQPVVDEFHVEYITSADVSVYEDGKLYDILRYRDTDNTYIGTKSPVYGKKYTLKVIENGFENLKSQASIPDSPQIVDVVLNSNEDGYSSETNVKLTFKDDGSKKNYYKLMIVGEFDEYYSFVDDETAEMFPEMFKKEENIPQVKRYFEIRTEDPVLTWEGENGGENSIEDVPDNLFDIFDDEIFDGKEYTLDFSFYNRMDMKSLNKISICLLSLSEDYYLYMRSYSSQYYFEDNPFSEPVQIYSNISGGAGVFGAYNIEEHVIYEKEEE